uniref:Putative secreted protein n=1 Tax=Ixodes ricinus TaxID=34613 RepID=A0A6B0UI45_IXORI
MVYRFLLIFFFQMWYNTFSITLGKYMHHKHKIQREKSRIKPPAVFETAPTRAVPIEITVHSVRVSRDAGESLASNPMTGLENSFLPLGRVFLGKLYI